MSTAKRLLKFLYNTASAFVLLGIVAVVGFFAVAYVLLSLPPVQDRIRQVAEREVSNYIHTHVTIDRVTVAPFNEVLLTGVKIPDQRGDSMIVVDRLGAGVSLFQLLFKQRLVFTYGEIIGLHGRVTKADKDAPLNIQFLIDVFKPKPGSPPKPFDVTVFNVVMRQCDLSYDVLNAPEPQAGRFDVNHARVTNLRADLALPRLKNNDFIIDLNRMSFNERSGVVVKQLSTLATINDTCMTFAGNRIELPNTVLTPADIGITYSSLSKLGEEIKQAVIHLEMTDNHITLSDLSPFVPALSPFTDPLQFTLNARGGMSGVDLRQLKVSTTNERIAINAQGSVRHLDDVKQLAFDFPRLEIKAHATEIAKITGQLTRLTDQARGIVTRCGNVELTMSALGTPSSMQAMGYLVTDLGRVDLDGNLSYQGVSKSRNYKGMIHTEGLRLGRLLGKEPLLDGIALDADVDVRQQGKLLAVALDGHIDYIDLRGYRYRDIDADVSVDNKDIDGTVTVADERVRLNLDGNLHLDGPASLLNATIDVDRFDLSVLSLKGPYSQHSLSFKAQSGLTGNRVDNAQGTIELSDVTFANAEGKGLHLKRIAVNADNASTPQRIDLDSDIISGWVEGSYDFTTLVPVLRNMAATILPDIVEAQPQTDKGRTNQFDFHFDIEPQDEWQAMLRMPVRLLTTTTVDGMVNQEDNVCKVEVKAPYIQQGNKLIEQSYVTAQLDTTRQATLSVGTILPSKQGKIDVSLNADAADNKVNSDLRWNVHRNRDFHGLLSLSSALSRDDGRQLTADVRVNPSELVFNDTTWQVQPGHVLYENGIVQVNNVAGQNDRQFIRINGRASKDPDDALCLDLNDVSLDYVFDVLNIENVDFGGRATGKFYASDLFSGAPRLSTPNLHVDNLSYNNAVMGNADIQSHWMNEEKAVSLNAHLVQNNERFSDIGGAIFVADDSLHLVFDADHANVAFLQPFMKAFTSDVRGEVSGHAVLYGNFHDIDLSGDIVADSLTFKLDYTNVYYTTSNDTVHIQPGYISFDDVRIHDRHGHEGRFGGWLKHNCFHDPVFNFAITDARRLLCYDTDANINPDWYGIVYGNGSAFVSGEPGIVDIKVNMATAAGSKFTFVMSDTKEANEYSFITFRDRDKLNAPVDTVVNDTIPELVRRLTAQVQKNAAPPMPTGYSIDLQGDITPDLQLVIVMDPVGGDQIKCTGRGNLRLTYNNNDEMGMYGKYTLDKGNYNFSLQDIILKEFTINEGSSISFQGDPYTAHLNIEAVYSLNANLRDLDESFASDSEINRTNVPVQALLRAKGNISQPDISFDLAFPSLSTDAYRKVKSIISTDEMMNRQIIYLLAINRFYTPNYMGTTNNNNELTSVASSTISSQLSNMLGKMSENWTISPNFRSAKGDFSDVEVDVALSSQLLNNRLLINGNLGYRDVTYGNNTTNFIGDFDIEYLLNPRGTIRLKAYNHFNDQNYLVRNALTTQGVGVVFKHDFDRIFRRRRQVSTPVVAPAVVPVDSTTAPADTSLIRFGTKR